MNLRVILVAVVVLALAAAAYQAAMLFRTPHPAAPAAAPAPAPSPAPPAVTTTAGTKPYEVKAAEEFAPGIDAPFDATVARRITVEQVEQRLDAGKKVVFIDTRADIPDVMIKGAVRVTEDAIEAWGARNPKASFVVIYCTCANEATAAREVIALQKLGFEHAYALRDGLAAWQSFDLPTEQPPHEPPAS
jgi:rhodanese-related sulfurtransferase